MTIVYEWKIDFALLFTILGVICSFMYTFISNRKNRKRDELISLSAIINKVHYLLETPWKANLKKYKYTHANPYVKKIVCRMLNDFNSELDTYWSYYNKENRYPEVKNLKENEKKDIIEIVHIEYEKALREQSNFEYYIQSPTFYCDDKTVLENLKTVKDYLLSNSYRFCRYIRKQLRRLDLEDPVLIMEKYKNQLQYDPEYFYHNTLQFNDPYRFLLIMLRRRHEWLSMPVSEKLAEIFSQIKISKGNAFFRSPKWLHTGFF